MSRIRCLAWITFKEGIRHRSLYGIFIFALLICLADFIISDLFMLDVVKVSIDIALSAVSISGLLLIFFLGIPLLARDLDKRTIYMVICRPISRGEYILGKFFGFCLLLFVSTTLLSVFACATIKVMTLIYKSYTPMHFSWLKIAVGLFSIFVSLCVMQAVVLFFASFASGFFITSIFSLVTYFIGQNIGSVKRILATVQDVSPVIKTILKVASWIFPRLSAFDLKTMAAHGLPLKISFLIWNYVYGISYTAILLILAILIFRKRQLP